jgi:hypothetical protein
VAVAVHLKQLVLVLVVLVVVELVNLMEEQQRLQEQLTEAVVVGAVIQPQELEVLE